MAAPHVGNLGVRYVNPNPVDLAIFDREVGDVFFDLYQGGKITPVSGAGGHSIINVIARSTEEAVARVTEHPKLIVENIWHCTLDGKWSALVGSLP